MCICRNTTERIMSIVECLQKISKKMNFGWPKKQIDSVNTVDGANEGDEVDIHVYDKYK